MRLLVLVVLVRTGSGKLTKRIELLELRAQLRVYNARHYSSQTGKSRPVLPNFHRNPRGKEPQDEAQAKHGSNYRAIRGSDSIRYGDSPAPGSKYRQHKW